MKSQFFSSKLGLLMSGAALAVVFSACSYKGSSTMYASPSPSPADDTSMMYASPSPVASGMMAVKAPMLPLTVTLDAQNASGQKGTAKIEPTTDGKVKVTLTMTGGSFTAAQPAHIHIGSCPKPGAVQYPLTNVIDGKSVTMIDANWDAVWNSAEKLAVNVHKSASEASVYTACGNIK